MKYALAVSLLLLGLTASAQSVDWAQELEVFGHGVDVTPGSDGACYAVNDDGYMARFDIATGAMSWLVQPISNTHVISDVLWHPAGFAVCQGRVDNDVVVAAVNPSGDLLWSYTWTGDTLFGQPVPGELALDPFGNILAPTDIHVSNGGHALLKLSASGAFHWAREYHFTNLWDEETVAIAVDPVGNVFQSGWFEPEPGLRDWCLIKYSAGGQLLWTATYDRMDGSFDHSAHVLASASGECYLIGCTSGGELSGNDISIRKYSSSGTVLWTRHVNENSEDDIYDVAMDPDGNVVLVSVSIDGNGPGYLLAKVSPSNQVLWQQFQPSYYFLLHDVDIRDDGKIAICGRNAINDAVVALWTAEGALEWTHYFPQENSFGTYEAKSLRFDPEGGILVCGLYWDNWDFLVYRLCITPTGACLNDVEEQPGILADELAVVDLENDGLEDVIVTEFLDARLAVHRNDAGALAPADSVDLPFTPRWPLVGDVDEDGDQDVVVGAVAGGEYLVLRNEAGSLTPLSSEPIAPPIKNLRMADLDEVNGADIVVVHPASNVLSVLLNNGSGSFAQTLYPAPLSLGGFTTGDINVDGHLDVLVGSTVTDTIYLFAGTGDGALLPYVPIHSANTNNLHLGFGDVDADGINDILSVRLHNGSYLLRGTGNGNYAAPLNIPITVSFVEELHMRPFPEAPTVGFALATTTGASAYTFAQCTFNWQPRTIFQTSQRVSIGFATISNDVGMDVVGATAAETLLFRSNCDESGGVNLAIPPAQVTVNGSSGLSITVNGATALIGWTSRSDVGLVEVRDALGRHLSTATTRGNTCIMDLAGLAGGSYWVSVRTGDARFTGGFIVP